jgi:hypothetical protein
LAVAVEHPIRRARSVIPVRAIPLGFVSRHSTTHASDARPDSPRMVMSTKVLMLANLPGL